MKQFFALLLLASLASCDNSATGTNNTEDSIEARGDSLKQNVDSTIEAKIDSLQERGEELKVRFDSTAERRIDSVRGNN